MCLQVGDKEIPLEAAAGVQGANKSLNEGSKEREEGKTEIREAVKGRIGRAW